MAGGSPHVTRLDAVFLGCRKVDFDLDDGLFGLHFDLRIDDSIDAGDCLLDLFRLATQDIQVLAVKPHDDRFVDPRERFAKSRI